jgi:hypothetical protein
MWMIGTLSSAVMAASADRLRLNLARDGPDEARHLACDRRGDDNLRLTASSKAPPAAAQPNLRLPGDVADILRQSFEAIVQLAANPSLHAVGPGSLDQGASGLGIAGLGSAAPSHPDATRMLRGN